MKNKKKLRTEIHLKAVNKEGFTLKTSGTPEQLNEAIISLQAWFITEYVQPNKVADYLLDNTHTVRRILKEKKVKAFEFDIDKLLEQLGGKR